MLSSNLVELFLFSSKAQRHIHKVKSKGSRLSCLPPHDYHGKSSRLAGCEVFKGGFFARFSAAGTDIEGDRVKGGAGGGC